MILPDTDEGWVNFLGRMHDADIEEQRDLDALYRGTARLEYLQPELMRELDGRIQTVALGWPSLAVDPLEERLDLLTFRYPDEDDAPPTSETAADQRVELASAVGDANLQRVWQDNDLDEESQMAHVDALVMKRAYACVGSNEADASTPLVTFESPLEVFAYIDPRTRKVLAALRRWRDDETLVTRSRERFATLYLPDRTVHMIDNGRWRVEQLDEHNLGEVPIVSLTNRPRLAGRYGSSELTPALLSLSNAANKIATDMMVGAEFHAIPLRAIFGIGPKDLIDEKGNPVSALSVILGKVLTLQGQGQNLDGGGIRAHEFSASSLSNFHSTLQQLAQHAAGLLGLDPHELGHTAGDNPASAEGLRARETRLIKRAERRQRAFGGAHEKVARLVRRFQDGDWDPRAKRIEAVWRDAATPTRSQAADAAVKLFTADIIPRRQAWEDLGYTPSQQRRMQAELDRQAEDDPIGRATKLLGQPLPGDPAALPPAPGQGSTSVGD